MSGDVRAVFIVLHISQGHPYTSFTRIGHAKIQIQITPRNPYFRHIPVQTHQRIQKQKQKKDKKRDSICNALKLMPLYKLTSTPGVRDLLVIGHSVGGVRVRHRDHVAGA